MSILSTIAASRAFGFRDEQRAFAAPSRLERDRQHAFDGANRTVERQFADKAEIFERRTVDFLGHRDHSERNRQIEARPLFLNVCRREIYRGPSARPVITAIRNRGRDAVAAFFHRGVRKSDDDNDRIAAGAVYLDFHLVSVDAVNRGGVNFRQHVAAELQKIAAPKSAKYPSKERCNGCLKVLSNIERKRRTTSYS